MSPNNAYYYRSVVIASRIPYHSDLTRLINCYITNSRIYLIIPLPANPLFCVLVFPALLLEVGGYNHVVLSRLCDKVQTFRFEAKLLERFVLAVNSKEFCCITIHTKDKVPTSQIIYKRLVKRHVASAAYYEVILSSKFIKLRHSCGRFAITLVIYIFNMYNKIFLFRVIYVDNGLPRHKN